MINMNNGPVKLGCRIHSLHLCRGVKLLATVVEGDQKAPFSIAATLMYREGGYTFLWIDPLYSWYVPYIAEC